jgi:hypothetical protein
MARQLRGRNFVAYLSQGPSRSVLWASAPWAFFWVFLVQLEQAAAHLLVVALQPFRPVRLYVLAQQIIPLERRLCSIITVFKQGGKVRAGDAKSQVFLGTIGTHFDVCACLCPL